MKDIKRFYFCPNCHCKVDTPKMILQVNIGGTVNLNCGNCNKDGDNPIGVIKIKGQKAQEDK